VTAAPRAIHEVVVSTLELARAETSMDAAVLGEIRDGRELVRLLDSDGGSFGLAVGASLLVEETYCQRLLEGRSPPPGGRASGGRIAPLRLQLAELRTRSAAKRRSDAYRDDLRDNAQVA
jgi:hypothetical protein